MEKIYFDKDTFIWKTKGMFVKENKYLKEKSKLIIKSKKEKPDSKFDAYSYKNSKKHSNINGQIIIKNTLDEIIQKGIDICKELYKESNNIQYDNINFDSWVNMVRSKKPRQIQLKHNKMEEVDKYHVHTELSKNAGMFIPTYTWVYYIQMPDVMEGDDGVIYFKSKNGEEYFIRPEEDDLIVMPADMPHAPINAPKAKINRIVLAGNVGFDTIKKEKTIF